jgi:hypothetical protein
MVMVRVVALLALSGLLSASVPAFADTVNGTTGDPALDAELAAQKEARKACKIEICAILRNKKVEGADISCGVTQTLTKKTLDAVLDKGKVKWPMGNAVCKVDLKISRAMLAKAMTEPKFDAAFEPHTMTCEIAPGAEGGEKTVIKMSIKPTVSYISGVATKGALNWGDVEAPALVKGVIWPVVTLDNTVGLFGGNFVSMINQFSTTSCDEVKDQIPAN